MNPQQFLNPLSEAELADLVAECASILEVSTLYAALRRGLTGNELDRLSLFLNNSIEREEDD